MQSDGADGLEALRTELIHRVVGRVPDFVFEINEIHCWNSRDFIERDMIIKKRPVQQAEMLSASKRPRRFKHAAREFFRRVEWKRDGLVFIADHVQNDAEIVFGRFSGGAQ